MIYIETSSFLDYYLDRPRAEQIREMLVKHQKPMVLNPLIELEVNSVLGRLVNQKVLTQHERIDFDQDLYYDQTITGKFPDTIPPDFPDTLS
jgi:predicted nucleic acid-binding protein